MQFTLQIKCDNAVFENSLNWEIARILNRLSADLVDHKITGSTNGGLYDINGNKVGKYSLEA